MNNGPEATPDKHYAFSPADKIKWQDTIRFQLFRAASAKKYYKRYHLEVSILEDCINDNFYGIDLATPTRNNIEYLDSIKQQEQQKLILACDNYMHYHPKTWGELTTRDKDIIQEKMYFWYWHKRFEHCRHLLAQHRGLLWGSLDSRAVTYGELDK